MKIPHGAREWRVLLRSIVVIAVGIWSLWFGLSRVWPFTIDDSGIVYAYAKHIASGLGPRAVVGGPIVEGYSDFLWVILLSGLAKLGLDLPTVAKVVGSFFFLCSCVASGAVVRRMTRQSDSGIGWLEALPTVLMALCPEIVVWAPSGLENALYSSLMMALLWLDLREVDDDALRPYSAAVALGLCLTRPEGIAYAAVIAAAKLTDAVRSRAARPKLSIFVGSSMLGLSIYYLGNYWTFRSLLPNTYYAKAPGFGSLSNGITYVLSGVDAMHILWIVPLALAGCLAGMRRTLPTLACVVAALGFAVYSRGDWMPHFRFVGFAIPPLVTLAAVGIGLITRRMGLLVRRPMLDQTLACLATVALSLAWFSHHSGRFDAVRWIKWCHFCSRSEDAQNHQVFRDRIGLPEASFLTHDFGAPSYVSSPKFLPLDLLGLCDQPAALLNFELKRVGLPRFEFLRTQYFFDEQSAYPTLLYFPDNFWRALSSSPEFRLGYMEAHVPPRKDGRIIAPTRLARAAFVDYFPFVDHFSFQDIDDRFTLVGAGAFRSETSNSGLLDVSLVQRKASADPVVLTARVGAVAGQSVALFRQEPSLGAEIGPNEPLLVQLPLPVGATGAEPVEIVVASKDKTASVFTMPSVHALAPHPARLPFPNDLPGTNNTELQALGRQLRVLIARRPERGDLALTDPALGKRLLAAANPADTNDARSDTYLALVWASQADPDLVRSVYRRIAALRSDCARAPFLEELALLRSFYESRDPLVQLDLVLFYASVRLWDKAAYFAERLPDTRLATPTNVWVREVTHAKDLIQTQPVIDSHPGAAAAVRVPGVASDFEGEPLQWARRGRAFDVLKDDGRIAPLWGTDGTGFFSSENPIAGGPAATGEAQSPPFVIDARAMSFLVAGDSSPRLGVDLVIEGKSVLHETGPRSRYFFPVMWDLRRFRGKLAILRLEDSDKKGFIAIDHLRVWPELSPMPP